MYWRWEAGPHTIARRSHPWIWVNPIVYQFRQFVTSGRSRVLERCCQTKQCPMLFTGSTVERRRTLRLYNQWSSRHCRPKMIVTPYPCSCTSSEREILRQRIRYDDDSAFTLDYERVWQISDQRESTMTTAYSGVGRGLDSLERDQAEACGGGWIRLINHKKWAC